MSFGRKNVGYIVYLDEVNAYFFQKALEDEQFIKGSKDKLKDIIVGGVKTTVITTAGLYNAAVGVYATAIGF